MNSRHIDWSPNYELGIEDIDFQHHLFLNLINRLSGELEDAELPEYKVSIVAELNAYARFHFISEENMMVKADYPQLAEHKEHHRKLIDQLSAKGNMLLKKGSEKEGQRIIDFLVDWFVNHTRVEDRLFADYMRTRAAENLQS